MDLLIAEGNGCPQWRTHQQTKELHNVGILLELSAVFLRIGVGTYVSVELIRCKDRSAPMKNIEMVGQLTCTIEA
jgi:hypothetical protein